MLHGSLQQHRHVGEWLLPEEVHGKRLFRSMLNGYRLVEKTRVLYCTADGYRYPSTCFCGRLFSCGRSRTVFLPGVLVRRLVSAEVRLYDGGMRPLPITFPGKAKCLLPLIPGRRHNVLSGQAEAWLAVFLFPIFQVSPVSLPSRDKRLSCVRKRRSIWWVWPCGNSTRRLVVFVSTSHAFPKNAKKALMNF